MSSTKKALQEQELMIPGLLKDEFTWGRNTIASLKKKKVSIPTKTALEITGCCHKLENDAGGGIFINDLLSVYSNPCNTPQQHITYS